MDALSASGTGGDPSAWIRDYLHIHARLWCHKSHLRDQPRVPQGGVLGTLLLNLVTGAMPEIYARAMCADDVCICSWAQPMIQLRLHGITKHLAHRWAELSSAKLAVVPFTQQGLLKYAIYVNGWPVKFYQPTEASWDRHWQQADRVCRCKFLPRSRYRITRMGCGVQLAIRGDQHNLTYDRCTEPFVAAT